MVVDDSPLARKLITLSLERAGYRVLTAEDGLEALERIPVERPELVVLDVIMPKMDGLQVCRRLKQDPGLAAIPVVVLTTQAQGKDREAAQKAGADDYLTKPFSPGKLRAIVERLLRASP